MISPFMDRIEEYLRPLSDLSPYDWDSTYFLRKEISFVFAQGYCHPQGAIYGKIIIYPKADGELAIFGKRFSLTNKKMINGKMALLPYNRQMELQYNYDPSLRPAGSMPPFADYFIPFPIGELRGYFDNRHSMRINISKHPFLRKIVEEVSRLLETPLENIGCTGSLSYGRVERGKEDCDLVFYGTVEQNYRLFKKITKLASSPERRVSEFGRYWPMRFYHHGYLICPFFKYSDVSEIPVKDDRFTVIDEDMAIQGTVADDRHTMYMPIVIGLGDITGIKHKRLYLIVYDSIVRGEYRRGNRLSVRGRVVEFGSDDDTIEAILVTNAETIERI